MGTHVAALDGLRPLLILWVISFHWSTDAIVEEPWPSQLAFLTLTAQKLQRHAWVACDAFFCLAGFVAALGRGGDALLDRGAGAGRRAAAFAWRSVARLAPAYYGSLAAWVALLALHDAKMAHHDPAYRRTDLAIAKGGPALPLALCGLQAWYPVFQRDLTTPREVYRDNFEPLRRVFTPYAVDYPLWFASALVGCYVMYGVAARYAPSSRVGLAGAILGCCFLRLLPALVYAAWPDLFCDARLISPHPGSGLVGGALDNVIQYMPFKREMERNRADLDTPWICDGALMVQAVYVWPPVNFCSFLAGALTARLYRATPPPVLEAVRKGAAVGASACAAAVVLGTRSVSRGSPMCATRSTPLTVVFCAFCYLAAADGGDGGGVLRALRHPALVGLAPAAYAAYAFQAPAIKLADVLGYDRTGPAFLLVLVGLWGAAAAWAARVDPVLHGALLAVGPAADAAPAEPDARYGTFAAAAPTKAGHKASADVESFGCARNVAPAADAPAAPPPRAADRDRRVDVDRAPRRAVDVDEEGLDDRAPEDDGRAEPLLARFVGDATF